MPTSVDSVRPAVPLVPAPRAPMHITDEVAVHPAVPQLASPSTAVAVASESPNAKPVSVTLATADAMLYGEAEVGVGPAGCEWGPAVTVKMTSRQRYKRCGGQTHPSGITNSAIVRIVC